MGREEVVGGRVGMEGKRWRGVRGGVGRRGEEVVGFYGEGVAGEKGGGEVGGGGGSEWGYKRGK